VWRQANASAPLQGVDEFIAHGLLLEQLIAGLFRECSEVAQ
jgi:hypothetical protein